jgi:ankyrin repeat protein
VADIAKLVDAAKSGDLRKVRESLSDNFLLASQRLQNGESPLMAALYRGHYAVVEALIDAGAEIDVFAAAALGRVEDLHRTITDQTVNAYAYDGWTALHLASFFGRPDAVTALLDSGADIHAVSRNSLENTPLHAAVAGRHADVALCLLDRGASGTALDGGGYSPSDIAAENGLTEVVAAIKRS